MGKDWEIKVPEDCTVTNWPIQIVPVDDWREHDIDSPCWCKPVFMDNNTLLVHNSMDDRESYERGEKEYQ